MILKFDEIEIPPYHNIIFPAKPDKISEDEWMRWKILFGMECDPFGNMTPFSGQALFDVIATAYCKKFKKEKDAREESGK
jgi:hypothetical protein